MGVGAGSPCTAYRRRCRRGRARPLAAWRNDRFLIQGHMHRPRSRAVTEEIKNGIKYVTEKVTAPSSSNRSVVGTSAVPRKRQAKAHWNQARTIAPSLLFVRGGASKIGAASPGLKQEKALLGDDDSRVDGFSSARCIIAGQPWAVRFATCWDLLQVAALFYVVILVPLRIGFSIYVVPYSDAWWLELVVDLYFIADIFLSMFCRAMYNSTHEVWDTNRRHIRRQYLRSWFAIDFVSCFPTSYILLVASEVQGKDTRDGATNFKIFKLLRLLRLMKLLRLAKVSLLPPFVFFVFCVRPPKPQRWLLLARSGAWSYSMRTYWQTSSTS